VASEDGSGGTLGAGNKKARLGERAWGKEEI
jgi:hypothetical protein